MSAVYRADPPAMRVSVGADEMTILYHRPSGATHILASPAPELLDALGDGPADAAALVARLAAAHELAGDADLVAVVAERLAELEAAGLVARVAGG